LARRVGGLEKAMSALAEARAAVADGEAGAVDIAEADALLGHRPAARPQIARHTFKLKV
jgi:hypothetical protein